jgi:cbb3-type cytochrome oxidase subunit 1
MSFNNNQTRYQNMQPPQQSLPSAETSPSRLPNTCFILATVTVISGMCLGIYMGLSHDFTLAPAHAHANLLGWVSLFLFGLFYRTHPQAITRMARLQIAAFVVAYIAMVGGMAGVLLDVETLLPVAIMGSLLLVVSMLQFLLIAWTSCPAYAAKGA